MAARFGFEGATAGTPSSRILRDHPLRKLRRRSEINPKLTTRNRLR